MGETSFKWNRFWLPANAPLPASDGYLFHPDRPNFLGSGFGQSFDELHQIPCLILLGPPGIGKSYEMRKAAAAAAQQGQAVEFVEIRRIFQPNDLLERLVSASSSSVGKDLDRCLNIFLDGLDEAVQLQPFANVIPEAIRAVAESRRSLDKLKLRISCRAASWPSNLQDELQTIWPKSQVGVYQLAPLREEDVLIAAHSIDADEGVQAHFLEQIRARDAEPLASRPVTLNLLLSEYRRERVLPSSRAQLYQRGLLALLEETNPLRRSNPPLGQLDSTSRLIVAARVAAAALFSNSTTIWTGLQSEDLPDGALRLSDITGGYEPGLGGMFPVRDAELFQVLNTPVFQSVGKDEFEFAHKTFPEFLAAYYLVERGLSADEVLRFLLGEIDSDQATVPPQLREIAAWGASLDHALFRKLTAREPDILLRSDVAAVGDAEREALTSELLQRFDEEQLHDWIANIKQSYSLLQHPKLAQQLAPYITGKNRGIIARRASIDMAEATHLTELSNVLLEVALDQSDHLLVRVEAASALSRIGSLEAKRSLRPLLHMDLQSDVDDELKGAVLRALWPNELSIEDLLRSLTPPKNENLIGLYSRFLDTIRIPQLSAEDSLRVLEWIDTIFSTESKEYRSAIKSLIPRLLRRAWDNSSDARVMAGFVRLIGDSLKDARASWFEIAHELGSEGFLASYHSGDIDQRLALAEEVLRQVDETRRAAYMLLHTPWPLLTTEDLPSVLDLLRRKPEMSEQLIDVILGLMTGPDLNRFEFVWRAAETLPKLNDALATAYSVELDSEPARRMKQMHLRQQRTDEMSVSFDVERYLRRVQDDLDGIEAKSSYDWWKLNILLFINEHGKLDTHLEFSPDLTRAHGWSLLSPMEQNRVVATALRYIVENGLDTTDWLGGNTHHRPAAAGYRAFRLLLERSPQAYAELDQSVWEKWAAAIIGFSSNDEVGDQEVRERVVADLYAKAPRCVLDILERLFSSDSGPSLQLLALVEVIFDDLIGDLVWSALGHAKFGEARRRDVLEFLLSRRYEPAVAFALGAISQGEPIDGSQIGDTDALASAASALLSNDAARAWPLIRSLNAKNEPLAEQIWLAVASSWSNGRGVQRSYLEVATPSEIADLYLWLLHKFPKPAEERGGARYLSAIDHVDDLRRALLTHLVELGTREAIVALEKLADALPSEGWLKWRVMDARQSYSARSWRSLQPRDVIAIIASFGATMPVRSTVEAISAQLKIVHDASISGGEELDAIIEVETVEKPDPPSEQPLRALRLLLVASEWSSAHGGLSSFNRELCKALAALGHEITCLVVEATEREKSEADLAGVKLIECPSAPGVSGLQRLLLFRPNLLPGYMPDAVIGHDHITGSQAEHISLSYGQPYVHFIHTLPEEIEPFKERHDSGVSSLLRGSEKRQAQARHCAGAKLVACVGPRIYSEVSTVIGTSYDIPIAQIDPGMDERLLSYQPNVARSLTSYCLFLGRLEDARLKGADLACSMIRYMTSNWEWPQTNKPKLIMRGFNQDKIAEEIASIGGVDGLLEHIKARGFTGDADEIAGDIRSASVIVMPSKREGFGLVALEGIAAGIPVVASVESGIGQFLLQASVDGHISKDTAAAYVADVDGDRDAITKDWAERGRAILIDRPAAFERARVLREQLREHLSWRRAAETLTLRIQQIL